MLGPQADRRALTLPVSQGHGQAREHLGGPETWRDEQEFVQEVQTEAVVWRSEAGLSSGGTTGKGQVRWAGSDTI